MALAYEASTTRRRATKAEMEERAAFLIDYAERHGSVTVRGLYYQTEVAGIPGIDKTDSGYAKVQRQVLLLRRAGRLSYSDIADATRWMRKPTSYSSVEEALKSTARLYRTALWVETDDYVEIWCKKDALAGVIYPVTSLYDVPLMVTRGFSSETFCFEAIEARGDDPRDFYVYYLGDFDRAGEGASKALIEKLARFSADKPFDVNFRQIAVTEELIQEWDLPTRKPKRESAADKRWSHRVACELDAIPADQLRALVQAHIELHLPSDQLEILKAAEESERELLKVNLGPDEKVLPALEPPPTQKVLNHFAAKQPAEQPKPVPPTVEPPSLSEQTNDDIPSKGGRGKNGRKAPRSPEKMMPPV
jgi:hypothetical protein